MALSPLQKLQLRDRANHPPPCVPARIGGIATAWIRRAIESPEREQIQSDGRIRRWTRVPESGGRLLRVVLLADGGTVHHAFVNRSFKQ